MLIYEKYMSVNKNKNKDHDDDNYSTNESQKDISWVGYFH